MHSILHRCKIDKNKQEKIFRRYDFMEELNKEPPLVLVRTWLDLLRNAEEKKVRDRANEMLLGAFGDDMEAIVKFMKKHNIK